MARLVVDSGTDEGMIYPLTESVVTLGRSPSSSIQVTDKRSSRLHAEIIRHGSNFQIRDLGSRNGTAVQGVRLTEPYTLRHGDQVRIGHTLFIFEDEEQSRASTAARRGSSSAIRLADKTEAHARSSIPAGVTHTLEAVAERGRPADVSKGDRPLAVLLQVLEKVRSVFDLDQLLTEIMELIFEVFRPERGFIMLLDEKTGALVPRVVKLTGDPEAISVSRTVVHQALRERMSLLITDAAADSRFQRVESVVTHRIRSAICAPLIAQDSVLGVLYIDSRSHKVDYGQEELELLTGITDQAAMAISNALLHENLVEQNRLERELEIARTIQMNLLPKHPPIVPGFDIAAMSIPAKRVGGDYYDFVAIDSDHLGVAVADVSGKGVPAAILTASVRAALQIEARRREDGLEMIVSNLNDMACRDAAIDMFIALFFGILQISTRRFRYVNAGHCFPFVLDAEGKETRLEEGGCVLGVMPDAKFEQGEIRLVPRSTLIVYSDGVSDVLNERKEAFGVDRLRQIVVENPDATAEALRKKIDEATSAHRGKAEQFDDYTLVVLRAL